MMQTLKKERPIMFSEKMVLAILNDEKTQTRRPLRHQPKEKRPTAACPYGVVGDLLWGRETFAFDHCRAWDSPKKIDPYLPANAAYYKAGWKGSYARWKAGIFMPRWASRLELEIVGAELQRLQDISEEDARAEGCSGVAEFRSLWREMHGAAKSWDCNPWVWKLSFQRRTS